MQRLARVVWLPICTATGLMSAQRAPGRAGAARARRRGAGRIPTALWLPASRLGEPSQRAQQGGSAGAARAAAGPRHSAGVSSLHVAPDVLDDEQQEQEGTACSRLWGPGATQSRRRVGSLPCSRPAQRGCCCCRDHAVPRCAQTRPTAGRLAPLVRSLIRVGNVVHDVAPAGRRGVGWCEQTKPSVS